MLACTGVVAGRRARTKRERVGRQVDAHDRAVLGEPGPVATGAASGVEDPFGAAQPGREEIRGQRARVAVPPVVVLDRGDARVLLDLHVWGGYREAVSVWRPQRAATRTVSMTRSDDDQACTPTRSPVAASRPRSVDACFEALDRQHLDAVHLRH